LAKNWISLRRTAKDFGLKAEVTDKQIEKCLAIKKFMGLT
jgi:hypothetical protein